MYGQDAVGADMFAPDSVVGKRSFQAVTTIYKNHAKRNRPIPAGLSTGCDNGYHPGFQLGSRQGMPKRG